MWFSAVRSCAKRTLRRAKRDGFTLVELLVVIAIVGVIAAILLPTFATVRERGRNTGCQSNLKQIALAMQQYVQDNGGVYPPPAYNGRTWATAAYAYTKSVQVFRCPDHPEGSSERFVVDPTNVSGLYPVDYDYDFFRLLTLSPLAMTGKIQGTHESMLMTPSSIRLNMDAVWITPDGEWHDGRAAPRSSCGRSGGGSTLHSNGGNYSYVDGHVKWLTPEQAGEIECQNDPFLPLLYR